MIFWVIYYTSATRITNHLVIKIKATIIQNSFLLFCSILCHLQPKTYKYGYDTNNIGRAQVQMIDGWHSADDFRWKRKSKNRIKSIVFLFVHLFNSWSVKSLWNMEASYSFIKWYFKNGLFYVTKTCLIKNILRIENLDKVDI